MSNKISALQRVTQIWRCQLGPNIIRVEPERNHKSIHFKTSKLSDHGCFQTELENLFIFLYQSRIHFGLFSFHFRLESFPSMGMSCGCELGRLFATESLREICWPAAGLRGS